jgi:hypothetical protein
VHRMCKMNIGNKLNIFAASEDTCKLFEVKSMKTLSDILFPFCDTEDIQLIFFLSPGDLSQCFLTYLELQMLLPVKKLSG